MERFWSRVDKNGPAVRPELGRCWEWRAALTRGYGKFKFNGVLHRAHRVSWLLEHGDWPPECALHKCDNRKCVNPAHLFAGSKFDNVRDMYKKGIRRAIDKLCEGQVRIIRASTNSANDAAACFGVRRETIKLIRAGKLWRHVA